MPVISVWYSEGRKSQYLILPLVENINPSVNGNQKCSDFGNSECSSFGIKTTVFLASVVQ